MLKVGENVSCVVESIGPYGIYASTIDGQRIYLSLAEMSWRRQSTPFDLVSSGDHIVVKIIGFNKIDRELALGSIRESMPDLNPWLDPKKYRVGETQVGTVVDTRSKGLVFARLPGGALTLVNGIDQNDFSPGKTVKLIITEVDAESHVIVSALHSGNSSSGRESSNAGLES